MESEKLKESLLKIAGEVKPGTTPEDVYKQLSYFADIEESEQQEKNGETRTQEEVELYFKV